MPDYAYSSIGEPDRRKLLVKTDVHPLECISLVYRLRIGRELSRVVRRSRNRVGRNQVCLVAISERIVAMVQYGSTDYGKSLTVSVPLDLSSFF